MENNYVGGFTMNEDEKFIDIAIELSKKAVYPYGAIIVKIER